MRVVYKAKNMIFFRRIFLVKKIHSVKWLGKDYLVAENFRGIHLIPADDVILKVFGKGSMNIIKSEA